MLLRISLVVAILAGLGVGALNFVKVKEKVVTLQINLKEQTDGRKKAESELADKTKELESKVAELNTTKQTLQATSAERDEAVAKADAEAKRAQKAANDLVKARKDLEDVQANIAAYKNTDLSPEQIMAMKKDVKGLRDSLSGIQEENKLLGQKIKKLETELAIYRDPTFVVPLPAALRGKILVTDPKWNFVIIDKGQDDGVLEQGELLVNRNGKLVAKVKVRSVQKDRCVANVLPGWQLGEVMEGDMVIPAHPAS